MYILNSATYALVDETIFWLIRIVKFNLARGLGTGSGLHLHIVGSDYATDGGVAKLEIVADVLLGVVTTPVDHDHGLIA